MQKALEELEWHEELLEEVEIDLELGMGMDAIRSVQGGWKKDEDA